MLHAREDPGPGTVAVPVVNVFDGDGFLTRIFSPRRQCDVQYAIRFGFIDAPEMGQYGGAEARDFLTQLIGGRWVDLAILMKTDTGGIVDRHRRIVAVPYLRCPTDPAASRNIELEMLLNGWAWLLERYGPEDSYYGALEDAQRHRRGIWAREDNIEPWEFKRRTYAARRSKRQPSNQMNLFNDDTP